MLPTLSIVLFVRQKLPPFHLPPQKTSPATKDSHSSDLGLCDWQNTRYKFKSGYFDELSQQSQKIFHRSQAEAAQDQNTWLSLSYTQKLPLPHKLFLFCVLWNRTGAASSLEYRSPWRPPWFSDSTPITRECAVEETGKSRKRALHSRVK